MVHDAAFPIARDLHAVLDIKLSSNMNGIRALLLGTILERGFERRISQHLYA